MEKIKELDELTVITDVVVEAMKDKKGEKITVLDLRNLSNRVVDIFIICHASSDRQVDAIASSVEDKMNEDLHERVWHREGYENKEWILLDYVNVVVHIFQKEKRDFYAIEELWGDAESTSYSSAN